MKVQPVLKLWQRWPALLYFSLTDQILRLHLRSRVGLRGLFKVNPGLPYGGLMDSKFDRYSIFRSCEYAIPTILIQNPRNTDLEMLRQYLRREGIDGPIVAKPNLDTSSQGVNKFETPNELHAFLEGQDIEYIIQPYVEYPLEFTIYYYRLPGESHGEILDVTERVLPKIRGNGRSTVRELLAEKGELGGVISSFKDNISDEALDHILGYNETLQLSIAAGSSQGVLFADSRSLITPELRQRIDSISVNVSGFYWGKFDVKAASYDDLAVGRKLKLIEVNGVKAELNYIYDRNCSYEEARKGVLWQIELLYEIANRNKPHPTSSLSSILLQLYGLALQTAKFKRTNKCKNFRS